MPVRTRSLVAALFVASLAIALAVPRAQAGPGPRIRPGRVWVTFKDGGDAAALQRKATALGGGRVVRTAPGLGSVVLQVPLGQEEALARQWAARPGVAVAAPIHAARILTIPNDGDYSAQWALPDIHAPQAWDVITATRQVTIAVVDTGVDLDHPDLTAQIWTNADETPDNGLDDDGNGFVDDLHGWNFVHPGSNAVQDDYGHGTHVAGIAAATADNGKGIAGVSWGATILPVKVLGSDGSGWDDDIALGVKYAVDNGARIVNLSLGGSEELSATREALAYAQAQGALVVAAAGNSGGAVLYPAAYSDAMAVVATNPADQKASFSCYGPEISVAAPGEGILSTNNGGGYGYMSGTSMAAPHVSGLAALVWALHPAYGPDEVRASIERSADDVNYAEHPGWDEYLGWGRINAARAVGAELHWTWLPCVWRDRATRVDGAESHPAWLPYALRP